MSTPAAQANPPTVATPLYTGVEGGLRSLQPSHALMWVTMWVFDRFAGTGAAWITRQQLNQFNAACGDGDISEATWEWLVDAFPFEYIEVRACLRAGVRPRAAFGVNVRSFVSPRAAVCAPSGRAFSSCLR